MEDFIDYDPADNSAKSYAAGIKAIRLERIRRGISHPRPHCPDEVSAWREGVIARAAIFGAVVASFIAVGVVAVCVKSGDDLVSTASAETGR